MRLPNMSRAADTCDQPVQYEGQVLPPRALRFGRTAFEVEDTKFRLSELVYGREANGQSALYIVPDA